MFLEIISYLTTPKGEHIADNVMEPKNPPDPMPVQLNYSNSHENRHRFGG